MGGVLWCGFDDTNMVPYVPVYGCSTLCPEPYAQQTADPFTFSLKSAYWLQNALSNFVYPRYCQLFPEVQQARDALDSELESLQEQVEKAAAALSQEEAVRYLTGYTARTSGLMMDRWRTLFERLIVKYNDFTEKPEADGQYKRTAGGEHVPVIRPGYPERYRRTVIESTGDRYLMPEK